MPALPQPFVEEHPEGTLARGDKIGPAILVQIHDSELPVERDAFAGRGDGVTRERALSAMPLVVVDRGRLRGAGIAAVVGPEAFAVE